MLGLHNLDKNNFIGGGIVSDMRADGRKRLAYRRIAVETGVISQASGSARVKIGHTDVIVGVKAELGKPSSCHPDKGRVSISVECSPIADPMFQGRGGDELCAELETTLQQCLLGGKSGAGAAVDLSSLSVVPAKVCWDLYIHGLVVDNDGNLLDALGAAIKAALSDTCIPCVHVSADASSNEHPEVDLSDEEFVKFDTSSVPVIVTLTKVGMHCIVDATTKEESYMSSAVSISVNRKGHICGLSKRGCAVLDPADIPDMVNKAQVVGAELANKLDSLIDAAEARKEEENEP